MSVRVSFIFFFSCQFRHKDMENKTTMVKRAFVFVHLFSFSSLSSRLVEPLWFAHGRFDVESADVLPVLLEQRNEKVDRQIDVGRELLHAHADIANGHRQADGFLRLEFNRGFDLVHFLHQGIAVRDGRGKLTGLVQARTCASEIDEHDRTVVALPRIRGICRMTTSEARNASYC